MLWIGSLLLAITTGLGWQAAQAASGLPNSPQFGYGGRISTITQSAEALIGPIQQAGQSGLDWIALDYDWASHTPTSGPPNLAVLDGVMNLAAQNGLHALVSITNAPAWSLSEGGPNPAAVSELTTQLAQRFPGTLLAVELFPAANTAQGWGAPANPAAYANLFQSTQAALQANRLEIALIAAGLTPIPESPAPGDMGDLDFLARLYETGALTEMPIIGLRLPALTGSPLADSGPTSLRHIEAVRQVMLDHNQADGLIWITRFVWPEGIADPQAQGQWLVQAYELLQARLYMGAAFFDLLPATQGAPALIALDGQAHPGLLNLAQLIQTRRANLSASTPKKIMPRTSFKPIS
jgi:hypothetical protein